MARLELDEGNVIRTVEIRVRGASHEVRTGSFEYGNQARTKESHIAFLDEADAWRAFDEAVRTRIEEGYRVIAEGGDPLPVDAAEVRELDALLAGGEHDSACLVFGDWLLRRGASAHGELIATQAKLEEHPHDPVLREAELALLQVCGPARAHATWRRGFVRTLDLPSPTEKSLRMRKLALGSVDLGAILAQPIARIVERIAIHPHDMISEDHQDIIDALVRAAPPSLRALELASFEIGRERVMSWTQLGDVRNLWRALPSLRELTLAGVSITLGEIDAPELRRFTLRSSGLSADSARAIAGARWPHLASLEVWFGSTYFADAIAPAYQFTPIRLASLDDIRPLLHEPPPALVHLGLRNAELTDELCAALPGTNVLRQLATLDLSMGTMTDDGALALIRHANAFAHLDRLDVSDNLLTPSAIALLQGVCREVVCGGQRRPHPDGERYVSLIE